MTNEVKTEPVDLTAEQLDEAHGGGVIEANASRLTISGADPISSGANTYTGATVIREGTLLI